MRKKVRKKSRFFDFGAGLASLLLAGTALAPLKVIGATPPDVRRDASVIAIEQVMPCVVNISTETIVQIRDPFEGLFREFFGPDWGQRAEQSLGSGVIIDDTGYLITNFHVVRRASRITVTLADKTEYEAKLVGVAYKSDVALLKLVTKNKNQKFKAVRFASDDDLLLGETVIALGNPFGLGGSVSRGILSSLTRRPRNANEPAELDVEDWLQTDAAINPGNSGGPLINLRGELIGINVAVFREGQGIGFAIPVKRVSEALAEISTPESVKSLWFGARFSMSTNGIVVANIESGSPAEKSGLKVGDRILQVNGSTPSSVIEANRELFDSPKSEASFAIQRSAERRNVKVRLVPEKEVFNADLIRKRLGATLQELTPELALNMGYTQINGLLISGVDRNSPASEADLRPGLLIHKIDGQELRDLIHAAKILHKKKPEERVTLNLVVPRRRGAFIQYVPASIEVILR